MEFTELKKKIKNFDLKFLKYIDPETKELGNKVILFSCIVVLLSFYKTSISEIEINGIKFELGRELLLGILFIINFYYFLLFLNASKIDQLLAKMPSEYTEISDLLYEKSNNFIIDTENIIKKKESQLTEKEKENLNEEIKKLDNDSTTTEELLSYWKEVTEDAIKYNNQNRLLNQ